MTTAVSIIDAADDAVDAAATDVWLARRLNGSPYQLAGLPVCRVLHIALDDSMPRNLFDN